MIKVGNVIRRITDKAHCEGQCLLKHRSKRGPGAALNEHWQTAFTDVLPPHPRADCSEENPCEGLSRHATFTNFGMAFLTLFRVSTGDNWNGIMKVCAISLPSLSFFFIDMELQFSGKCRHLWSENKNSFLKSQVCSQSVVLPKSCSA